MSALNGHVTNATIGAVGFDTATAVTQQALNEARHRGYKFAIRYVRRQAAHPGSELTRDEAQLILNNGLALMAVQYVESEDGWTPSAAKGTTNGQTAVQFAQQCGLPPGINLWCDLEGVDTAADWSVTNAYCRNWYAAVKAGGYVPGLYVGWHPGLNPTQLYNLPFTHYWRSYNLNDDQAPAVRGTQMTQRSHSALPGLDPSTFDEDVVTGDKKGGVPIWLAPPTG
jgi:hypothetical protein